MSRADSRIYAEKAGGPVLPAFSFAPVRHWVAFLCLFLAAVAVAQAEQSPQLHTPKPVPSDEEPLRLSLQDCIDIAIEKNLGLINRRDSVRTAESSLAIQKGAFRPTLYTTYLGSIYNSHIIQDYGNQVGISLTQTHEYGGTVSLSSSLDWTEHESEYRTDSLSTLYSDSFGSKSEFTSSFGVSASQQFLKGAFCRAATASLRQAEFDVALAELDLEDLLLDLSLLVKQSFYTVLKSQEYITVMESALAASEQDLRIARLRLTEGLSSRLDHSRAELVHINRKRDLNTAKKQLQSAIDRLVEQMGLDIGARVTPVPGVSKERIPIRTEEWIEKAFRARPDMRAMRVQLDKHKVSEESARNNVLPTLEAEGSFTVSETDDKFREPLDVTERVWQFSLKFDHGFFDISDDELLVQSKIASRQLARTLEDSKREIAVSIRELSRQLKRLSEDIEYLERAEQIASEQLELARLSYEEGLITNRDLITAENDHTAARIDHIRAIYDYLSTVASLDRALGK